MTYVREESQVPFLVRVVWFFLLGWHLALYWIVIAWVLNITIIGLPLGLWMLNRVPLVLTLRMPRSYVVGQPGPGGTTVWTTQNVEQPSVFLRIAYFILIGWWLSLIWALVAWFLSITIIGLPVGVWMFNRLPGVTTLMKQ